MLQTIDVDQHLFESRTTWSEYIDPARQADALSIADDDAGWPWLMWRGNRLSPLEVPIPERSSLIGEDRLRRLRGERAPASFEELVPDSYRLAGARLASLNAFGLDAAVMFPNYGLLWEQRLASDRDAQRAERTGVQPLRRRCVRRRGRQAVWSGPRAAARSGLGGGGDPTGASTGRAPGHDRARLRVDGKPLSHPDFDAVWAAFSDEGVAPVFHVSDFESPLHPAWRTGEQEEGEQLFDSIFLYLAPAVALANLILTGMLERFPLLRVGVVELTASWVPSFLLHIDGASDFYTQRHGEPFHKLSDRPSNYFLRQVRVAALPYEMPNRLVPKVGDDTFMLGSDWPHAEGVADPMAQAQRAVAGLAEPARANMLGGNAAWLLGL